MKSRILLFLVILLLGAGWIGGSGLAKAAQPGAGEPPTPAQMEGGRYRLANAPGLGQPVENKASPPLPAGVSGGGRYLLQNLAAASRLAASGGNYRLITSSAKTSSTGCCCTFLPCLLK